MSLFAPHDDGIVTEERQNKGPRSNKTYSEGSKVFTLSGRTSWVSRFKTLEKPSAWSWKV
jgi:hypothetical protein